MADRNKDLDNNSGASAAAAPSHAAQVAALGHGRRTAADGADAAAGAHAGAAQLRPASDALASSPAETQGAKTKEVSSVTTSVKQEQQSAAPVVLNPIHGNGISKEKVSSTSSSVSDPRASDPVNISNSADSPVKPQKKKKSSVSALIARFEESQSSENLSEDQQKSASSGSERSKVPLRSTRSVTPDKILSDLGDEAQVAPRPKSAVDHSVVNHHQNHDQELPLGAEALAVNQEEPSETDQEATHEYLEGLEEEDIDIDEMTRRNGAYTSYVLIGASAPNNSHNDLETASIHSSGSSGGSSGNRVIVNVNKGVVLQDGRASNISIVSTESSDLGSGSPPAEGVDPQNLFELVPDIPAKIRARNGVVDPSLGPDMQYFVAREPPRQDFGQRSRGGGGDPDEYLDDPSMTNYYTNAIEGSSGPSSGGSRRGRPPVVRAADRSLRRQQMFHEEIGEGEIMVEYDEYHPHPDQVEGGLPLDGAHPENFHITEVGPNGEHYEVYTDEILDPDDEYDVRYESEEHSGDEQYVDNLQDYPMCQPVQYDSEEYISEGDEYFDREEELRGYNRQIDFTLHTILEESCEDSDANSSEQEAKRQGATGGTGEQKRSKRHSDPSEMEKYFLYGVGGGNAEDHDEEYYTTTGSSSPDEVLEDDLELMHPHGLVNGNVQPSYDAENILLNEEEEGEQGPQSMMSDRQNTDDSGSVGSESDGARTPEHQAAKIIKKKAVRGLHKGQSRSSDNGSQSDEDQDQYDPGSMKRNVNKKGRRGSASDAEVKKHLNNSETAENTANKVTNNHGSPSNSQSSFSPKGSPPITPLPSQIIEVQPIHGPSSSVTDPASAEDKSPKSISPVHHHGPGTVNAIRKHKSRDSGFVGSMDDLLRNEVASNGHHVNHSSDSSQSISDECENNTALKSASGLTGMTTGMSRLEKVSEVSGEDDNTLTDQANDPITHQLTRKDSFTWSSDEDTNIMMNRMRAFFRQIITTSAPSSVSNEKPPQLVAFEAKLTRMMKTVPGINEDQVKEIVEYLSSEDTWSDSYDSSDYTSSDIDLEVYGINVNNIKDEDLIEQENLQRETALMYSKLMAKMHEDNQQNQLNKSPPIAAQVMAHISSKLVALMHESESEVELTTTPTASSRFVFFFFFNLV